MPAQLSQLGTPGDGDRATALQLSDLLGRIDTANPSEEDLAELRRLLALNPALSRVFPDISQNAERQLIRYHGGDPQVAAVLTAQCQDLRRQLGAGTATAVEHLLIDAVVNAWLLYHTISAQYAQNIARDLSLSQLRWWEDRLSAAQRRHLNAIESLVRTRKLLSRTPNVQVNIAAGGQQLNVAGDLLGESEK